jgi:aspartate aminotransferase
MPKVKKENLHVNLNLNVRGLKTSATLAINEKSNQLLKEGKKVFKLGLGQSPFPVPESVVEELRKNAHQKDYLPVKGLAKLRESIAEFNLRTQKVETHPDDVMIGPGSKELIFILQLVYYGDLIIPTPSWVSYSPQARIIGRHVHWVPTKEENDWRLVPEELEMICKNDPDRPRILILNYPSNPTGYTYKLHQLKELARIARKYHVVLISDEIYGLLNHQGQHVSIARFYPEGTIISSGLSKWCGAGGWRLGTFSFPSSLKWLQDAMATAASETFTSTSAPIQYAAIRAFEGGDDIDEYLHNSRRVLRFLGKYIAEKLKDMNVEIDMPQGGFYLFPNFKKYRLRLRKQNLLSSVDLCNEMLEKTGVAMLPGSDFGRVQDELTARLAYVDFDGAEALAACKNEYADKLLDKKFAETHCPNIVEAFDRLGNWLVDMK